MKNSTPLSILSTKTLYLEEKSDIIDLAGETMSFTSDVQDWFNNILKVK